jgi:hypothetical protein
VRPATLKRGEGLASANRMAPLAFHIPHHVSSISNAATAEMNMTVAEQVYEQAKLLPQPLAQEALDFVLFLRARQEREEWRDLTAAQSTALAAVWDNEEDEAWNDV